MVFTVSIEQIDVKKSATVYENFEEIDMYLFCIIIANQLFLLYTLLLLFKNYFD